MVGQRRLLTVGALIGTCALGMRGLADTPISTPTAALTTQSVGATAFAWTTLTDTVVGGTTNVPTHRLSSCGYWSAWHLLHINQVARTRRYGEFIYDGCNNDRQLFP